jgi:hypothetical protein
MATKEQYDFFRFLHEDEERTYQALEARSRFYFAVISLFLASLLFKATEAQTSAAVLGLPAWVLSLVASVLAASLVLVVLAARIRTYEGIADPEQIIAAFRKTAPTDTDFFDDRIADLAVATNRNATVNDRVAALLFYAGACLAFGMLVLLSSLVFFFRASGG